MRVSRMPAVLETEEMVEKWLNTAQYGRQLKASARCMMDAFITLRQRRGRESYRCLTREVHALLL